MTMYRFWTDNMLRQTEFELKGRLQTMRKLAERGYAVTEPFEAVENDLLELIREQKRRKELQQE